MNVRCIENFFTVQDFWATCACPEKQSLPWIFSLYWIYLLHSEFLSNLPLPWKTECALNSLYWIYIFYHSGFIATCVCPEKKFPWNFSLYWNIFYHSGFLSNLRLPENRVCLEIFQAGRVGGSPHGSYAYVITTPNHVINVFEVCNAWFMEITDKLNNRFRCWNLQSLCDKNASYFSRILNISGRNTGPRLPGDPRL